MKIVVTHLTRMRGGYICVAGLDPDRDCPRHVRPVLAEGALPFDLLHRYGGPFDMGHVVDLGSPRHLPQPPHVEDYCVVQARLRMTGRCPGDEFWKLLERIARERLGEIFGPDLKPIGRRSCGTEVGRGAVSLGCFRPLRKPHLSYLQGGPARRGKIRMALGDEDLDVIVGVTDLRLYGDDHMTPDAPAVARLAGRIEAAESLLLGVGLTRPFAPASGPGGREFHWLQVTNVYLEEEPVWRLG